MRVRTVLFLSLATLLLAATVMTIPAHSAPVAQSPNTVPESHNAEMSVEATYAYWSTERMASAIPDPASVRPAGQAGTVDPALAAPQGSATAVDGCPPGKERCGTANILQQSLIEPMGTITQYLPHTFPYMYSYMVGAWSQFFPERTNAKLFYTRSGVDYIGSATVLYDNGAGVNRLVVTAGSTVAFGGVWDSGAFVCPAYSNAIGPWGCWAATTFWSWPSWRNSTDWRYNYGFITTAITSTSGYGRIGTVIGSEGWCVNCNYMEEFWSFGYPAAAPFDGNYLIYNTSTTALIDNVNGLGAPYETMIGTAMSDYGHVGGAWTINQRLAVAGWVVGEYSYWYGAAHEWGSSFQNADWLTLYNSARVSNP